MAVLRNLLIMLSGIIVMFFAVSFGLVVFLLLGVVGLVFWGYFKLRQKDIIHKMNEMGMNPQHRASEHDDAQTIDAEYEVVEEPLEKLDKS